MSELMSRSDEVAYVPFMFGYSNYARPNFAPHVVRFKDIPSVRTRASVLGGIGLAVSAYSEHRQIAIDYALFVATQECQRGLYFESGGSRAPGAGPIPRSTSFRATFSRIPCGRWISPTCALPHRVPRISRTGGGDHQ